MTLRRSPLVRRTPLSRGSGMPPTVGGLTRMAIARKRVARSPEEARARRVVTARADGRCEARGCPDPTDWAHRVGRAQGGPWCPSNGLALCRSCHQWCDHAGNRDEAEALGWMLRRRHDPAATPVLLHRHGWVLLDPAGGITPTERGAA